MLLDFFVWDTYMKKARDIYRNRHTVAGRLCDETWLS